MNSWYNIPEPPLDPPEPVVVGYCDHCHEEIYEGEDIYEIDGFVVHEDCLLDYVKENIAIKREAEKYVHC